jgi:hypothetical protein
VEARASRKARREVVVTPTPVGRVTRGKRVVKKTVKWKAPLVAKK